MRVILGATDRKDMKKEGASYRVESAIVHENYSMVNQSNAPYDAVLLRLERPIPVGEKHIRSTCCLKKSAAYFNISFVHF